MCDIHIADLHTAHREVHWNINGIRHHQGVGYVLHLLEGTAAILHTAKKQRGRGNVTMRQLEQKNAPVDRVSQKHGAVELILLDLLLRMVLLLLLALCCYPAALPCITTYDVIPSSMDRDYAFKMSSSPEQ